MDDAPAPPPEQIFAVGDTVVVRAIVRQVARDECYLQIEGGNPRWQFWIPAKAIEGKPIRTAPPLFEPGDRVMMTGTVLMVSDRGVTVVPDHLPMPRPTGRLKLEVGYLSPIEAADRGLTRPQSSPR